MDQRNQLEGRRNERRRLVLFPVPYHGHFPPMLHVAYILHARGFHITVVHTATVPTTLRHTDHPDFTFVRIPDGVSPEEASQTDTVTRVFDQINGCVQPFTDCLDSIIKEAPEDERVVCLIADALLGFTKAVADSFKLPIITLRTSNASNFIPLTMLYGDGDNHSRLSYQSRSEEEIPDLAPLKFKDLPTLECPDEDKLYQLLNRLVKQTMFSSGIMINTFEELEEKPLAQMREFGTPCFPIGPFHKHSSTARVRLGEDDDPSIIPWLDSQAPSSVVYVSFGSGAKIDAVEFAEVAWGLISSGRPFLFVHRSDLIRRSGPPEGLPEGFESGIGKVVKWAPQREVLAHPAIGAFFTHAGWNSTMESICEGVPMICLPFETDQMGTARYVADFWRIGIYVEKGLERDEVARAIQTVMEGEEMRSTAIQLKEKARLALEPGGSSALNLDNLVRFILSLD